MADWIAFTEANVLGEFTPAERAQLNNIQGSTENLAGIIVDVIAEFRQAITDAGTDLSGAADATIPAGFRANAVALARWRWLIAIPQAKAMQTVERKEAATDAKDLLKAIAERKRIVTAPDSSSTGGASLLSDDTNPFSRLGSS